MKRFYTIIFITVIAMGVVVSLIQGSINNKKEKEGQELRSIISEMGLNDIGKSKEQQVEQKEQIKEQIKEDQNMEFQKQILQQGTGPKAENGDTITAHYEGALLDGTVFDSSVKRGEPFSFVLGEGRVIKGWEMGFLGAQKGEKMRLIIPPEYGYGEQGTPGGPIPPNATLVFEAEALDIQKPAAQ